MHRIGSRVGMAAVLAVFAFSAPLVARTLTAPLAIRQSGIENMMDELERTLNRLSRSMLETEPDQATRLDHALRQARQKLIKQKMAEAAAMIEGGRMEQARKLQTAILGELTELMTVLTRDTRGETDAEKRRRLEGWLQDMRDLRLAELEQLDDTLAVGNLPAILKNLDELLETIKKLSEEQADVLKQVEKPESRDLRELDEMAAKQAELRRRTDEAARDLKGDPESASELPRPGEAPLREASELQKAAEEDMVRGRKNEAHEKAKKALEELKKAEEDLKKERDRLAQLSPEQAGKMAEAQSKLAEQAQQMAKKMQDAQPGEKPEGGESPKPSQSQSEPQPGEKGQPGSPGEGSDDEGKEKKPKDGAPKEKEPQSIELLSKAHESMKKAEEKLKKKDLKAAGEEQRKAADELEKAMKELEEILAQMREEEIERLLASLESLFSEVLDRHRPVESRIVALDVVRAERDWNRMERLQIRDLAGEEQNLADLVRQANDMLEADGTSLVFPAMVRRVHGDMTTVQERLAAERIGVPTTILAKEITRTLEEIVEALKEIQKEKESKSGEPGESEDQQPQAQPLVPTSAELKLLKAGQLRVNRETLALDVAPPDARSEAARAEQVRTLADRQGEIQELAERMSEGQ